MSVTDALSQASTPRDLLAVNGSPASDSRTHAVAAAAVELAGAGRVVNLGDLDSEGLLSRREDAGVRELLQAMQQAPCLLLATPVYRATYSGLLKVVLDQLPLEGLSSTVCILAATGASPAHALSLDTGLRPVVASLAGWTVPTTVYATPDDFDPNGRPQSHVLDRLRRALDEATPIGSS